ncbi:dephospho-CoA kinase [Shewanella sp. FJAT-52076]|uniref:dephospho-CoA kinase n=1 Tax=Shewanella sp. FJAT-52076 TaxID=2864202 RepID=UPI001C655C86|nr:dephospho-CoA kinase [Shewanella sp. FJAT-52076]QYJ75769.1 dephospho-CoA kinase [Shewanella sp. FJAT-52076]
MSGFILGLTGGIGSGKTTVANLFHEHGIGLVDADVIAREVVEPGSAGLKAIEEHFGSGILKADGSLDRAKLREQIFTEESERMWLNNLLHPMIRQTMLLSAINADSDYVILVVPLLFENGLDSLVDRTLVVDISPDLQIQRTAERDNVSEAQIANIIASQISREERLQKADDIIDNRGEIADLREQVNRLHQFYLTLAASKAPHD